MKASLPEPRPMIKRAKSIDHFLAPMVGRKPYSKLPSAINRLPKLAGYLVDIIFWFQRPKKKVEIVEPIEYDAVVQPKNFKVAVESSWKFSELFKKFKKYEIFHKTKK